MAEQKDGCVKPARGPILASSATPAPAATSPAQEVRRMVHVGGEAIDFEANAFVANQGFKQIKLSDYKGKWIILCFYPGDFTFV